MTSRIDELVEALKRERLAQYGRLRGGFPILLAGAIYWGGLALSGYLVKSGTLTEGWWYFGSLFATGLIFPLALLFSNLSGIGLMKDRSPVGGVLFPTFVSMLLFWPMLLGAVSLNNGPMVILILAIGLSLHFPVIGWSYGKTLLFCGYAVLRAIAVLFIWRTYPEEHFTWIPLLVCASYLTMALVVALDSGRYRHQAVVA